MRVWQLLLGKELSCHVQNIKSASEIRERYSTRGIVCQFCERMFVLNVSWRRRLDSWGLETGERCDNTEER